MSLGPQPGEVRGTPPHRINGWVLLAQGLEGRPHRTEELGFGLSLYLRLDYPARQGGQSTFAQFGWMYWMSQASA